MNTKKLSFIFLLLLASQMLFVSFATTSVTLTDNDNTVNLVEEQNFISETDLDRVETTIDIFENGGFESWDNPHEPAELVTRRTSMIDIDLEFAIVSEGARSAKMMAKGIDVDHPAIAKLYPNPWGSMGNPANLTVSFDYYIDVLVNPDLGDTLELSIPFGSYDVHYILGSTASMSNSTFDVYYILDTGPLQQWNTFDRNATQDYIDYYGSAPNQLDKFTFFLISYVFEYSTVYIDDVIFSNGTYVHVGGLINGGNFETGFIGYWWYGFTTAEGSGDISQSTTRVEGDWSLNMTVNTIGDTGFTKLTNRIYKMISTTNKDQFSLYWNIADWQVSTSDSMAYLKLEVSNVTDEFNVYYLLGFGGIDPTIGNSDDIVIFVDDFNTTGTWNLFNRSVMDDVNTRYSCTLLDITEIVFYATAEADGSRVSILFDDVSFVTTIMHDGGYEDQGAVGDPIYGWDGAFDSNPSHTVTSFSANGNKAANLTLVDGSQIGLYQEFGIDIPITQTTELFLDLNWYIESFNESSNDHLVLTLYFDDNTMIFSIMNASSLELSGWDFYEDEVFVPQSETNTIGEWVNWQIDLVQTFEEFFGELPNSTLYEVTLDASADVSSNFTIFMDDFYIYEDSAPEIIQVTQIPTDVDEVGDVVEITAEVVDASTTIVTLSYRVDSGAWLNVTMVETTDGIFEVEFNSPWGDIEYFVTATDAFGKTDVAMYGSEYFTFSADDTISPNITLAPANESIVSDTVSIEIAVNDSGSGFANSELFIEGTSIANVTLDTVGISWDTTVIPNGEYNITVVAEDNAGNTAVVTHLVTVENVGAPADLSGVILIVVVIAIIGAVAVIYIFVLKKK